MGVVRTKEYVMSYISSFNYTPILDEFLGSQTKFNIICPKGHKFDITWNNFQQGKRCPICAGNKKMSDDDIKNKVNKLGLKLLSIKRNHNMQLEIKCDKDHISNIQYGNLMDRKICPVCSRERTKVSKERVLDFLKNKGYGWISGDYIDNNSNIQLKCEKGHIFTSYWRLLNSGNGCCPICHGNRSIGEKEVADLILSIYNGTVIFNDRQNIINPKTGYYLELDIYIPELNKAIEYNSTWTHRDIETKYKDEQKIIQCENLGINLLIIDDKEWFNDKDKQKNKIKMFMGGK